MLLAKIMIVEEKMEKEFWEYKIVSGTLNEQDLNEMARIGWELIQIIEDGFVFKRLKKEEHLREILKG